LYVFLNANVEENESKAPGEKSGWQHGERKSAERYLVIRRCVMPVPDLARPCVGSCESDLYLGHSWAGNRRSRWISWRCTLTLIKPKPNIFRHILVV
jgi:hypothetical protein